MHARKNPNREAHYQRPHPARLTQAAQAVAQAAPAVTTASSPLPDLCDWKDVKNSQALHLIRVIERKTIGNPAAAIMPHNRETWESEFCHDGSHIACHGSL